MLNIRENGGERGGREMSDPFVTKVDVLDFLIETLKEHEKNLDALIYRLETVAEFNEKCARSS